MRLQPYRFKVKYLPGEQNIVDSLSRLLHAENQAGPYAVQKASDEFVRFVAVTATLRNDNTRDWRSVSRRQKNSVSCINI